MKNLIFSNYMYSGAIQFECRLVIILTKLPSVQIDE